MTHHEHTHQTPEPQACTPWYRTWTGLACLGAVALAAVYLPLFHVDHVLDALPLLVLLQWPTVLTLAVFPLLVLMYGRYAAVTPGWMPHLSSQGPNHPRVGGAFGA
ncbi:hypothetical protein [Azospirillum sp.]|uniref:hypothetical protein n=1 Tax=Azospirillum sp. TaxID=34012 RepID=UPI003D741E0B